MAKIGRICGICGNIGQIEKYSAQAPAGNQPGIWLCQNCRQTEMAERRKSDKAGPPKRYENSKVKFLSSEEVISISSETIKRCIKRTTTTHTSSIKTATPSRDPSPTQTSVAKSDSETEPPLSAKKLLSGKLASASSSGSKEMGHNMDSLKGQLHYQLHSRKCITSKTCLWKGSLEVHDSFGNNLVELAAYVPLQVSVKLLGAIETLPAKLQMKMVPRTTAWPKQFSTDFPNFKDIGVFLLPLERSSRWKCNNLLRKLDSKRNALKMNVNASHELVVHSSQSLTENSQRIEGELFFWGFIWKRKIRSGSKKRKFSSPGVSPGKTCSEFSTPIAQDKRSDVLKSNQLGMEAIVDASDVRENNSLEKETVVDTFDVPLGFTKPPIGQEMSPMDRHSESSKPGKKTQLAYNEIAPGCSSNFYRLNEESGRKQLFSYIGAGILEPTFEDCEIQEECPEAPCWTDKTLERRDESKRALEQPNASPGIPHNLAGCDIIADKMPQQHESPLAFDTSDQILIKQEKEPLFPYPVGLEIPPGYSRKEVEARKENSISIQHLKTPPDFSPFDRALIKQEQVVFPPLVELGISPCFSRSIEARKEKIIPSECKGSKPSMNQVLNVHRSVSYDFMDRPLLENQGIVHQQSPVGQRTVVFAYPAIQAMTSHSCDTQPTCPGAATSIQETPHRRAIAEVSVNYSQSIQMPTNHIENYSEQSRSISSMHATGEKQRVPNSLPTPDVKHKDASFSQMASQRRDGCNRLSAALYNANVPVPTPAVSHFCGLNPSFLAGSSRDGYHSSINIKAADNAMLREDESQRGYVRRSPVWIQETSRSRSPVPRRHRSRSRSPVPRRHRSRSRSPVPRRHRSRSRSPMLRRHRSRSRSPVQRQHKGRSRSPIRRRDRSRTRSPGQRWHRSRSRSPVSRKHKSQSRNSSRWNRDPVCRRNMSWVRSPERASNSHDCGHNSSQFKSQCSRSRDDSASYDSLTSFRRGRDRSMSLSPPSPVESPRH